MERIILTTPNLLVIVLTGILSAAIFFLAGHSIKHSADPKKAARGWVIFASGFILFVLMLSILAVTGFFDQAPVPPKMLVILLPVLLLVTWLVRKGLKGPASFLLRISPALLVGIQSFRILVEIILDMLHKDGLVPVEITFRGLNFDIITGSLALVAALMLRRKNNASIYFGIGFNILGLLALVNIITIAFRSVPGPMFVFERNYLPTYFPGMLIPAVFVVLALLLHVVSLRQLLVLKKKNSVRSVESEDLGLVVKN
jgi:hypothetical protein